MKKIEKIINYITRSIYMDFQYFLIDGSIFAKLVFVSKKYFILLRHKFVPFKISNSKIKLFGRDYYYESDLGLVLYQVSLIHHRNMLKKLDLPIEKTVLFDIGANVGCFTLIYRDVYPKTFSYCFEPVPTVFECLKENLINLDNCILENFAISDVEGEFSFSYDSKNTEMGMINPNGNIRVTTKKLDEYILDKNIDHIDFLKIDTETFEKHVLLGGTKALSLTKYLLIEINFEKGNKNYTVPELTSLLKSDLYSFQLLEIINFLDKNISTTQVLDFLFINNKYVTK